jgi:hypothetical protein
MALSVQNKELQVSALKKTSISRTKAVKQEATYMVFTNPKKIKIQMENITNFICVNKLLAADL